MVPNTTNKDWLLNLIPNQNEHTLKMIHEIEMYFGLQRSKTILKHSQKTLFSPVVDILSRDSKEFRAKLVELGCLMVQENQVYKVSPPHLQETLEIFKGCVEMLHAGSLIIDDIMDESMERRGKPAIHVKYGTTAAICSGNWLHFWPFRLVSFTHMNAEQKYFACNLMSQTIELCYIGQSIDSSLTYDVVEVGELEDLSQAMMDLKSGALIGLSLALGAIAFGAKESEIQCIYDFGREFGVTLQLFDDLGNIRSEKDISKRLEDLAKFKINGVSAFLNNYFGNEALSKLHEMSCQKNMGNLDDSAILAWFDELHFESKFRLFIEEKIKNIIEKFSTKLNLSSESIALTKIMELFQMLRTAY